MSTASTETRIKRDQIWSDSKTGFEIKVDRTNKKWVYFHRRTGGGPEIRVSMEDFLASYRLVDTKAPKPNSVAA